MAESFEVTSGAGCSSQTALGGGIADFELSSDWDIPSGELDMEAVELDRFPASPEPCRASPTAEDFIVDFFVAQAAKVAEYRAMVSPYLGLEPPCDLVVQEAVTRVELKPGMATGEVTAPVQQFACHHRLSVVQASRFHVFFAQLRQADAPPPAPCLRYCHGSATGLCPLKPSAPPPKVRSGMGWGQARSRAGVSTPPSND